MRTTPFILMGALLSSACYQYFPVADDSPLPEAGAEVRVQLESPEALDLGTMTLNDVTTVEGHVNSSRSDTLSLFSSMLRTSYGFRQRTNGAVFFFDRSQFGRLEERKIVPWRSGVAIGVSTIGLAALMHFALDLGGGSESGQVPVEPNIGRTANIPLNLLFPLLIP